MTDAGSTSLRKITIGNAAKFPNDVFVINLASSNLGGFDGFDIDLSLPVTDVLPGAVAAYIQPDTITSDKISFQLNGAVAASGGDDAISLIGPGQFQNPFVTTKPTVTGGPGNDAIATTTGFQNRFVEITAYGGSGDDAIFGGINDDTIFGDEFDDGSISPEGILTIDVPAVGGGNDQLFGGKGSDKVNGNPGNDLIDGGPRGDGDTDIVSGGTGSDAFLLSYASPGGGGDDFWTGYANLLGQTLGLDETKEIVNAAFEAADEDFVKSIGGAIVATGIEDGLGVLVQAFKAFLGDLLASDKPNSTEDMLIITDFDPSADVIFLPIDTSVSLTGTPGTFTNLPGGESGSGVQFTDSDTNAIFATVLFSEDYLEALDIEGSFDKQINAQVQQLLATQGTFTSTELKNNSPIAKELADGALTGKALPNTEIGVFGAFGAMTNVNSSKLGGTVFSDVLTVNNQVVSPLDTASAGITLFDGNGFLRGFAGGDLLIGGNGPDTIYGDEGDDDIYGLTSILLSDGTIAQEFFYGGAGNDLIVTDGSRAQVEGGDGLDTLSFEGSNKPVTIDLSFENSKGDNVAYWGTGTQTNPQYTLTGIENATGTPGVDAITGNASDNVIDGNGGNDTLDGITGIDTLSFASLPGPVMVDLTNGTAGSSPGATEPFTYSIQGFENVIGTVAADSITGDANDNEITGNGGADVLSGGGGTDTVSFVSAIGDLTIDLRNQLVAGSGAEGATIAGFEAAIGGMAANNTFYGFTDPNVQSALIGVQVPSATIFTDTFFPNAAAEHMESKATSGGVSYENSPSGVSVNLTQAGPQSGGWAEGDVLNIAIPRFSLEGSKYADNLTGNGGKTLIGGDGADIYGIGTGTNLVQNFVQSFEQGEEGDKIDVSSLGITSFNQLEVVLDPTRSFVSALIAKDSEIQFTGDVFDILLPTSIIFAPAEAGTLVANTNEPSVQLNLKQSIFENAFGVFEVGADKTIEDAEILSGNIRNNELGDQFSLDNVEAGEQFGFFLVQDFDLSEFDGRFAFENAQTGAPSTLDELDQAELIFTDTSGNEQTIDVPIFFSLNPGDGTEQGRTTDLPGGRTKLSFEDLDRHKMSDDDFNDLEIIIG